MKAGDLFQAIDKETRQVCRDAPVFAKKVTPILVDGIDARGNKRTFLRSHWQIAKWPDPNIN